MAAHGYLVTVGETFSIIVPLNVVLMSVLGGSRRWFGPAIGATAVTALLYIFTAGDYAVAGRAAVGLILVLGALMVVFTYLPPHVFLFENFFGYRYSGEFGILRDYTPYLVFK